MSHVLVKEQVDIFKYPAVDKEHQAAPEKQMTLGDLPGNSIKLIFFLVKHGVAKNISDIIMSN